MAPAPEPKAASSGISTGTGFFVSTRGHILTNAHVAAECRSLTVALPGSFPQPARLLATDKANDLALLVSPITPTVVPVLSPNLRTGDDVAVFGFPLSDTLSKTGNYTTGLITSTAGFHDDSGQMQISAPVQPGNSGGPVMDIGGNVIGVVVAKLNALEMAALKKDIPQNVNFAIKASVALNFLDANGVPRQPSTALSNQVLTNPDLADRAKAFTLFITCQH
ncbi:MAG: S1C family serine protease [Gammaproteobacteria bacterium]